MTSIGTDQHYVPQLLLKGFCENNSKRVWVFEKETSRVFPSNIRNVACQRGFYDFVVNNEMISFDSSLGKLEDDTAGLLDRVRSTTSVSWLSRSERIILATFVAAQFIRTDARRKMYHQLTERMYSSLEARNAAQSLLAALRPLTEEEAKQESILMLPKLTAELAPHVLEKRWVLNVAPNQSPLLIGDAPVAMDNTVGSRILNRPSLGFAVPGVEIYLPISHRLCLMFLCPSIEESLKNANLGASAYSDPEVKSLRDSLQAGVIHLNEANVEHSNSLQVANAERFVFGRSNHFSQVDAMLVLHPRLRRGPRIGPID